MLQSFLGPVDDSWLLAMQAGMLVAVERIATWRVDALFDSVVAPLASLAWHCWRGVDVVGCGCVLADARTQRRHIALGNLDTL